MHRCWYQAYEAIVGRLRVPPRARPLFAIVTLAALSWAACMAAAAALGRANPELLLPSSSEEWLEVDATAAQSSPQRERAEKPEQVTAASVSPWRRVYQDYRKECDLRLSAAANAVPQQNTSKSFALSLRSSETMRRCDVIPPRLVGVVDIVRSSVSLADIEAVDFDLRPGGHYEPPHCRPRWTVAIVIPFRSRWEHLAVWLLHMHPFLQRQELDYTVFVINQEKGSLFNRGMLMNIGFKEALKQRAYDCFVFHDVDLLPENDMNLYGCPDLSSPRHMSVSVDKFDYALPYPDIVGGAVAVITKDFEKLNGFSNIFFGWGGEDDDFALRIKASGLRLSRYKPSTARYVMIKHSSDAGNEVNERRFALLKCSASRQHTDGLNSLPYAVKHVQFRKLFTWISVAINELEVIRQRPTVVTDGDVCISPSAAPKAVRAMRFR